ncbi:hypothetical protein RND71_013819 [Anisodus tanguticus]|uniref:Uncharacterized protein n=1 Tax=Anisodus tanguticus TaxID=243964 RepID=A0AAE1S7Y6_9SOLA|nr:hypothetical protein RND71_013819 [Anisodus tanguticus]
MACFAILIQHKGEWETNNKYVDYVVDIVVIDSNFNFEDLIAIVSKQIWMDTTVNMVEIEYILSDQCPALLIHNNMSIRVYIQLKMKI